MNRETRRNGLGRAVDDDRCGDWLCAGGADRVRCLEHGCARGQDVVHQDDALVWRDPPSAAQGTPWAAFLLRIGVDAVVDALAALPARPPVHGRPAMAIR